MAAFPDLLKTLDQQVKENVFMDRMISTLASAFAVLATLLAAGRVARSVFGLYLPRNELLLASNACVDRASPQLTKS